MTTTTSFAEYAAQNWLNFGRDECGIFLTRDVNWTIKAMRKDGWTVVKNGDSQLMPDDSIRTYITASR